MSDPEPRAGRVVAVVGATAALALAIRVVVLLSFEEAAGDGPSRAALGYRWFLTRNITFDGHWLPGHEVLIGLTLHLVGDPAWAGRLLSLAAGTLCVLLLYALTRRLFGAEAALLAGLALALNPMHAALSTTSLSEVVGLAALLGLLLAAFRLADEPDRPGGWAAATAASLVGASVRLEFWLTIPLVALHHLARTRSAWRAAALAGLMLAFPLLWLALRTRPGGLVGAYAGTTSGVGSIGAHAVDAASGLASLGATLAATLGVPLLACAALGLAALARRDPGAPERRPDLALLLLLLGLQAAFLALFAADLGAAFWPRYVLAEAVLLLPLAAAGLATWLHPRPLRLAAGAVGAVAMLHAAWWREPNMYLVREIPATTREAAAWIGQLPAGEAVLLTRMGWQASYVPVLARLEWRRYRVVSYWLPDDQLRRFVRERHPSVVLTHDGDAELLDRLCRVAGVGARRDRPPLARFGRIAALGLDEAACAIPPPPGSPQTVESSPAGWHK